MKRTSRPVGVGTLMYVGDVPLEAPWRRQAAIGGAIALVYAFTGKHRPFRTTAAIAGVGAIIASGVLSA